MIVLVAVMEFLLAESIMKKAFHFYKKAYKLEKCCAQRYELIQFLKTLVCKKRCGFKEYFSDHNICSVAIYGIGMIYKSVEEEILDSIKIEYYIDKFSTLSELNTIQVIHKISDISKMKSVDAIIITSVGFYDEIKREMQKYNIKANLVEIEKVLYYDREKINITFKRNCCDGSR